jgi:muramidase (phage lysozyme)
MSVDIGIEYQPQVLNRMHQSAAAATYQIRLVIDKYQMKYQYFSRARAKKKLLATSIQQSLNKVGPARSSKRCKENAAIRVRDEDLIMHLVAYL